MRWLERLENRLHWLAIPGLLKWIALGSVIVFAWLWINPQAGVALALDRSAVLGGEFWRLFTFIFDPSFCCGFTPLGAVMLFFHVWIAFLVSDSLEELWGPTRLTLFILVTWIALAASLWILGITFPGAGYFLDVVMFCTFATFFPRYPLIFGIPVMIFAWVSLAHVVSQVLWFPPMFLVIAATFLAYAIWVLPEFIQRRRSLAEAGARRRRFQEKSTPEDDAFHRCNECGRTEVSDPELDFRTMHDGTEYCVDHLPGDVT